METPMKQCEKFEYTFRHYLLTTLTYYTYIRTWYVLIDTRKAANCTSL